MNLKLLTVLLIVGIFVADDVDAWRRWRWRRAIRYVKTAAVVGAVVGKRSAQGATQKPDLCDFKSYDLDNNGVADEKELLKSIVKEQSDKLDNLIESADVNNDGKITLDEFNAFDCRKAFASPERKTKAGQ